MCLSQNGYLVATRMKDSDIGVTVGKTLAYTSVQFYNSKGQLAARGSHTKYSTFLPLCHEVVTDSISRYVAGTLGPDGPFVAPAQFVDEVD
jgi:acyl-coenzyme A thioesterase 13